MKRARRSVGLIDCAKQDGVRIEHDRAWLRRIGRRRRDNIVRPEANEIVAHKFFDAYAMRKVNPERAHAGRKVIYEITKRADSLCERRRRSHRQSTNHPISLAAEVVADIGEAEQFELRRSPRTQVSQ